MRAGNRVAPQGQVQCVTGMRSDSSISACVGQKQSDDGMANYLVPSRATGSAQEKYSGINYGR
jgi:hypothetical protein